MTDGVAPDRPADPVLERIAHVALDEWARWVLRGGGIGGMGYGESVLSRAMRSLPSTTCRTCRGRGGLDGALCPSCQGSGRVNLSKPDDRANPAFIHGQGASRPPPPPPVVQLVHKVLAVESVDTRICVQVEYIARAGAPLDDRVAAARSWMKRAGVARWSIAPRTYQERLQHHRRRLGAVLSDEKLFRQNV